MAEKTAIKHDLKETVQHSSCHFGKYPHKISSARESNFFLKGLDYNRVKENTLCSGNLSDSSWKLLYITNLVVYVFHNRVLSALKWQGDQTIPRKRRVKKSLFLDE